MNLGVYSKTVAALTAGVLGWAAQVIASPSTAITAPEWLGLGTVLAAALGVYTVVNQPKTPSALRPTTYYTQPPTTTVTAVPAAPTTSAPPPPEVAS